MHVRASIRLVKPCPNVQGYFVQYGVLPSLPSGSVNHFISFCSFCLSFAEEKHEDLP